MPVGAGAAPVLSVLAGALELEEELELEGVALELLEGALLEAA